ncbi:MAG: ABC transporter substrate-binding protein [Cetobacterium sp.]
MKKTIAVLMSLMLYAPTYSLKIDGNKIVDKSGNIVQNKKYEKILVLDPAVVESFYLIEGEKSIVAIADTAKSPIWPVEKTKNLPKAGTIMKPSVEQVLSFEPDLVILNSMSEGFGEILKSRNIKFLVNEGKSLDSILENLTVYGSLTGQTKKAEEVSRIYRTKLENIKEKISKKPLNKKGAFLFSTSPMMVFNSESLPGQIFEILGIENISKGLPGGRPIVSPEYLIAQNPDLLVGSMAISNKDDILNSNPFVKQTKAAKNGSILIVDSNKILRATPRVIDALEDLYAELSDVK